MTQNNKKKVEDLSAREADALWETGEKVELEPPPPKSQRMSLFTMRLDRETFRALEQVAREQGAPVSSVARDLLREALERRTAMRSLQTDVSARTIYLLVADAIEARLKEIES